jgi:hypothetical protein
MPSWNDTVTGPETHWPVAGAQVDPPGQLTGVPAQAPDAHVSPVVHRLPSLHDAELLACWHDPPEQESFVQTLLSSQLIAACWQPDAVLQLSVVHPSLSLQSTGRLAWQVPSEPQTSVVQALPSLQSALVVHAPHPAIGRKLQTPRLHVSIEQELLSLHWASDEHAVAVGKPSQPMRPPVGPAVSAGEPASGL